MKKTSSERVILGSLSILLAASVSFAASDVPLRNWSVPSSGGLGKADHFTGPEAIFAPFRPCRLEDSRLSSGGAGPIVGVRTYDFVPGVITPSCGSELPGQVLALSLNFTVVGASGPGFLYAYPQGSPPPPVSILNYSTGETKSNAAIVPVGTGGQIVVGAGVNPTDVIIDINGVFYNTLTGLHQLLITATRDNGPAIYGQNLSPTAGSNGIGGFAVGGGGVVHGVEGQVGSASVSGSSGVHGINDSGAASAWGVLGEITDTTAGAVSAGVRGMHAGTTGFGIGVYGSHAGSGWGGYFTSSNLGVHAVSTNGTAIRAHSNATTGLVYGMDANTTSTTACAAGVRGYVGTAINCNFDYRIGVIGNSGTGAMNGIGVLGFATTRAVQGTLFSPAGVEQTSGILGFAPTVGVHSFSDITAAGTKFFIEPHPTDPDLEIAYASLEGNEAGTYFRGKGKFQNGLARIAVPEDFRIVSEADGLGIQVTPIGEMASVAVLRINLNEIVVKGSRNVEFFYTVNGVRKGRAGFRAVRKNALFKPASAQDKMLEWRPATREMLIQNGILTPGGAPNMETAERLGWKAEWDNRAAEVKARAAEAAAASAKEQTQQQ